MPDPIDINDIVIESSKAFAAKFNEGMAGPNPEHELIATVLKSAAGATGYGFLGDFPRLKEWIGERQLKDLAKHQYNIVNKLFESSVRVGRVDYEDNDYGRYGIVFKEMGYDARMHPDEHIFSLLKNGFTELCYDGQPFFDTDHPLEKGGTVSNAYIPPSNPQEGWYLLDTRRPIKPLIWQERIKPELQRVDDANDTHVFTYDEYLFGVRARGNAGYSFWQLAAGSQEELTAENFTKVYDGMMSQKDSEGKSLKIKPSILVVPVGLRAAAEAILLRERLDNGESNTNYKTVELLVSQDL
ncbi:Mu-like prophage major head subunit gpT family protein [Agarivorans sp. B2Z047]|uniref:Mu-like prophage major head subunit gpT family protein n=2 Tax=Agarivorans sp. B2Z047 TaxID=2652721 RepID=UPI002019A731|nr:Mu-like prophage major head subunit gpT family protein [Agarivorans sp. B2Z047]UQN40656.1 Mu-like prophage major head subunit gpT family protein [Agarivorans sp. B2Z047]